MSESFKLPRTLLILDYLLVATNIVGWVITLMYYHYVYTLHENPLLCHGNLFGLQINCAKVAASPYSYVPLPGGVKVPIALIAVAWFSTKAILCIYYILYDRRLIDAILILSAIGVPLIPYLLYIELVDVHALCTYCTFLQSFIVITLIVAIEIKLYMRKMKLSTTLPVSTIGLSGEKKS